jgi:ABC-type branched-subunit amino acid transport system substrate-binding protein
MALMTITFSGLVSSGAAGASGETFTIGGIGDLTGVSNSPQPTQGLAAYAKWTNAHGGIEGHKLNFLSCDGVEAASKFESCAHNFAGNTAVDAAADLGGDEFGESDPILAAAGIGVCDADPVTTPEFSTPNGVSATGGVPTSLGALVTYFAKVKHYKSIAFTSINGVGSQIQAIVQSFASPLGMTVTPYLFSETTTDFTATATALAGSGKDVIIGATGVTAVGPLLTALKEAGSTIPVSFFDTSITPAAIKEAGSASNSLYSTSAFPTAAVADTRDKKALTNYLAGMKAYGKPASTGALQGWACGLMITQIIKQLGVDDATRAGILNTMQNGTISNAPLYPVTMGKKVSAPAVPTFSSLINPNEFIGQFQNGVFKINASVGRVNPYKA